MKESDTLKAGIAILVAIFTIAVLLHSARTEAAGPKKWEPGVAPYATSFEDACRKAPGSLDGFKKMPMAVKEFFKSAMGTDCKNGVEKFITPDMLLEEMWSGGRVPHTINHIPMAELPVLKAPGGRSYPKGSMVQAAKALQWTVVYEGETYVLYLPYVCFNWTWMFAPVPLPEEKVEVCGTASYTVKPGDEVRFAVFAQKLLPASACWQLCDGATCSAPPSPCDVCDWVSPGEDAKIPADSKVQHSGRYIAQEAKQTLRFPLEVTRSYVALCATREGLGQSDSWVVPPAAWGGKAAVAIPYGGQQWPAWGQVDRSKWRKP